MFWNYQTKKDGFGFCLQVCVVCWRHLVESWARPSQMAVFKWWGSKYNPVPSTSILPIQMSECNFKGRIVTVQADVAELDQYCFYFRVESVGLASSDGLAFKYQGSLWFNLCMYEIYKCEH